MSDSDVLEQTKINVKLPSQYNVIILNDDITTQEYVIDILVNIFNHTLDNAYDIMMSVHEEGSGIAGTYEFQIAETKVMETQQANKNFGFNLQVKIEEN